MYLFQNIKNVQRKTSQRAIKVWGLCEEKGFGHGNLSGDLETIDYFAICFTSEYVCHNYEIAYTYKMSEKSE